MGLLEKIGEDMKASMKSGEKFRLETLRTLKAVLLEKQVEKRPSGGMTADDEIAALTSASKKRKESIDIYRQNNRNELADQEERELAIIMEYLPKQLSVSEIEAVVARIVGNESPPSPKDFGKVMSAVMKELKGKADGKLIQDSVKKLLGG